MAEKVNNIYLVDNKEFDENGAPGHTRCVAYVAHTAVAEENTNEPQMAPDQVNERNEKQAERREEKEVEKDQRKLTQKAAMKLVVQHSEGQKNGRHRR